MSYTYLITGATSDVGRALIERLLQNAPSDTLVITALISASLPISLTPTTVPLTVSVSPMKIGLANLHSTPWR